MRQAPPRRGLVRTVSDSRPVGHNRCRNRRTVFKDPEESPASVPSVRRRNTRHQRTMPVPLCRTSQSQQMRIVTLPGRLCFPSRGRQSQVGAFGVPAPGLFPATPDPHTLPRCSAATYMPKIVAPRMRSGLSSRSNPTLPTSRSVRSPATSLAADHARNWLPWGTL